MRKFNPIQGKTREEKLANLNSLEYCASIRQKKGKFYLVISELSLVATGHDVEEAYKNLCQQKQDFFDKIIDCEAEDEIVLPRKDQGIREIYQQLKIFACKLLIVCLLVGVSLTIVGALISNKVANISGVTIAKRTVRSFLVEAERTINDPVQREKLKRLIKGLQPVVREFQAAYSVPLNEKKKSNNEQSHVPKSQ